MRCLITLCIIRLITKSAFGYSPSISRRKVFGLKRSTGVFMENKNGDEIHLESNIISNIKRVEIDLSNFKGNEEPLVIETGKIGRQSSGAVTLTRGDTVVYTTACRSNEVRNVDFVPLSVEYCERFSSAGMTSGAFNRRDGRPSEHEILTCRLIDRPIRPLLKTRYDTQLISWVLSYDGVKSCDPLAVISSSAALYISDLNFAKPVAAVVIGYKEDDGFMLNPSIAELEESQLNLVMAGTSDGILMIEGTADFLPEKIVLEALEFGFPAIQTICDSIENLAKLVNKTKVEETFKCKSIIVLKDEIKQALSSIETDSLFRHQRKDDVSFEIKKLQQIVIENLKEDYEEEEILSAFQSWLKDEIYEHASSHKKRIDGRDFDEIREIVIEDGVLPRVHGSALFQRGETQTMATVTLGDKASLKKVDSLEGLFLKKFYLQYTFPPSCVGETGRVGAPSRREVGHGNLAERALLPTIPNETAFPYVIRAESLITESHGSSSMASVCGVSLALMDAGVQVKQPVAGIAMGMLLPKPTFNETEAIILSDITGLEDAVGAMDFKVAGSSEGITAFQLDIKCEGLTLNFLKKALEQARLGRIQILDTMFRVIKQPRSELPPTVPRITSFQVPPETIGKIIGPGGKQIRAIIDDYDLLNMDVQEDGTIQLSSFNTTQMQKCQKFVLDFTAPKEKNKLIKYDGLLPKNGTNFKGNITGIHAFGVFVEIIPPHNATSSGLEGLCHVSELHVERVRNCEGFMKGFKDGTLEVKYLGINPKGQVQLSRKALLEERSKEKNLNKKNKSTKAQTQAQAQSQMSQKELDVIHEFIT